MRSRIYKKILVIAFVSFLFVTPLYPISLVNEAHAIAGLEVPTSDAFVRATQKAFNIKEFSADKVAFIFANAAIQTISSSIVDWINSGFDGSPAFVQDLRRHFTDLGNEVFGAYINEIGAGFLCSPFSHKIKQSLEIQLAVAESGGRNARRAQFRRANQCTLDDVLDNIGASIEEFRNDFSKGGWPVWIEVTKARNNEIGAYLIVRQELFRRQGQEIQERREELVFGRGFLSWKKKCGLYDKPPGTDQTKPPGPNDGVDYTPNYDNDEFDDADDIWTGDCIDSTAGQIQTPGSVIENQLNNTLDAGQRRLQVADEVNEIISALFGQLVNQALGGLNGLFGASRSAPGAPSYTSRLGSENPDIEREKRVLILEIDDSIRNVDRVINIKRVALNDIQISLNSNERLNQCLISLRTLGGSYEQGQNALDSNNLQLTTLDEEAQG